MGWCQPAGGWGWVLCVVPYIPRGIGAGAACWWADKPLALEGRLQNDACQWWCYYGRMSSPKWLLPASPSPGGSPRSASGSDPGSFQTTASVLGLRLCKNLHVLFKSRGSVSYSPVTLPNISPTGFQSQMFWVLIFPMQDPWAREPDVGLGPLALWAGPLLLWYSSNLWVTDPGVWVLTICVSTPPTHLVAVPSLYL